MTLIRAVCVIFGGVACLVGADIVKPCSGAPQGGYSAPNDIFQASEYAIVPPSPKAGDTITGSFSGVVSEDINSGVISIDVKLSGIVPIKQDIPLSLIDNIKLPIKKGPFSLAESATLPDFLFGRVTGTVRILNEKGHQVTCVDVDVPLGSR